jgi:cytochrome oxidase assembly protein ShyY1
VFRVLTSRRWLAAFAAALAFAVAAFFLGRWQWHRYEAKSARAERIHAHYGATPRPLADVLPGGASLPLTEEWTRVTTEGRYAVDETLLVRNRPLDGTYGYEVVVPLVTDHGTLLVDRGWVQNAQNAETLPDFPAAPTGQVSMTGWLRPSEPSLHRDLPRGQLASISVSDAAGQVSQPLLGGYAILQSERAQDGSSPPRPTALEAPDTDLGPHQAYAFQWWAAMIGVFGLVYLGARREYLDGATDPTASSRRQPKVRIWDEEDA